MFRDIHVLDPILSILILAYVLFNVIKNLRKTFFVFMQGVPSDINLPDIEEKITKLDKVVSAHHTHIWSLEGETHVLTIHVVIGQLNSIKEIIEIKRKVKEVLRKVPIEHATVEIEFEDESCYMDS